MRTVVTTAKKQDVDAPVFEITLDDKLLHATKPKELIIQNVAGLIGDKYAPDAQVARAIFEFVYSCFPADEAQFLVGRITDPRDSFDTEDFANLFEAVMEEFKADDDANELKPVNRTARRASAAAAR